MDHSHQVRLPQFQRSVGRTTGVIKPHTGPQLDQPEPCMGPRNGLASLVRRQLFHGRHNRQGEQPCLPRRPHFHHRQPHIGLLDGVLQSRCPVHQLGLLHFASELQEHECLVDGLWRRSGTGLLDDGLYVLCQLLR